MVVVVAVEFTTGAEYETRTPPDLGAARVRPGPTAFLSKPTGGAARGGRCRRLKPLDSAPPVSRRLAGNDALAVDRQPAWSRRGAGQQRPHWIAGARREPQLQVTPCD